MKLRTLGGLELEGSSFSRPKPLLLLAYLALEGPKPRRFVAELFWPGSERARRNLSMTLTRLRRSVPEAIDAESGSERLAVPLEVDAEALLAALAGSDPEAALERYTGPFLEGVELPSWGVELEEWVHARREFYAAAVRDALLQLAERRARRGRFEAAAARAEEAWRLVGAPPLEPARLGRLLALLVAGASPVAANVRREASSLDLEPPSSREEARELLRGPAPPAKQLPHDLPPREALFVGREEELALLNGLLAALHCRLLTLVGPAGVGKTRLALEAARAQLEAGRFRDGVHFVSLASITDPTLVLPTIAQVLGVPENPSRSPLETVAAWLGGTAVLLVLDNFEQVVDAAPRVGDLLAACSNVTVLVSSRVPLHLSVERQVPVAPLAVPEPGSGAAVLARTPAVALFVERARATVPGFEVDDANAAAIAAITRRLDGLPLALELAAARIKLLGPRALLERLDERLELLTKGPRDRPERHRTLRAAIAWSHDLLERDERALFRRLSVFVGGFTLAAAEAIATRTEAAAAEPEESTLDRIAALVDHSLVRPETRLPRARFRLLETIREYGLERLHEAGERAVTERAHAEHFLTLAEHAEPELTGSEPGVWLERLDLEHDNLRAALDWAERAGEAETGLRLGVALWRFWIARGHLREGRDRLQRLLVLPGGGALDARVRVLNGLGTITHEIGDFVAARTLFEESLALGRRIGNAPGVASALTNLGWIAFNLGDNAAAASLSEEALASSRACGEQRGVALALNNLGWIAMFRGRAAEARTRFEESLALRLELDDRRGIAFALTNLAWAEQRCGDRAAATELLERALAILEELDDAQLLGWVHTVSGHVVRDRGALDEAVARYREGAVRFREVGNKDGLAVAQRALADVLGDRGEEASGSESAREAFALWREIGSRWGIAAALWSRGRLARLRGDDAEARALFGRSLRLRCEIGDDLGVARCLESLARLDVAAGAPRRSARLLAAAERLRERLGAPLSPRERAEREELLGMIRDALEPEALREAWRRGRERSRAATVADALATSSEGEAEGAA